MSITIKKDAWQIKDDNGVYRSADLFSTMLPSEAKTLVAETQIEFTNMQNQLTSLAASKTQEIINEGSAQVTAVNTKGQEVLASIPNDYTIASHAVDAILQGGFIYNTANGDVANFDDGADEMLIKSLVANIELQQDLHGYDYPWPAGGGNNLCDIPISGYSLVNGELTGSPSDDTSINATNPDFIPVVAGTSIAISWDSSVFPSDSTQSHQISWYDSTKTFLNRTTSSSSNPYITSAPDNAAYFRIRFFLDLSHRMNQATVNSCKFMVNVGTAALPYEPYSNICSISGHTGAEATRMGKNLIPTRDPYTYDVTTYSFNEDGSVKVKSNGVEISMTGYNFWESNTDKCVPTGSYRCILTGSGTGFDELSLQAYVNGSAVINGKDITFTVHESDTSSYVRLRAPRDNEYDCTVYPLMIYSTETDTTWEPYKFDTISVNWQSAADTVYGGMVTLNSDRTGTLTVNKVITTVTSVDKAVKTNGYCSVGIGAKNSVRDDYGISNILKWSDDISSDYDCFRIQNSSVNNRAQIVIRFSGDKSTSMTQTLEYTNNKLAELSAAGTPLQVVYELTEPIQYPLTESEISGVLTTLLGVNRVWVDTGDVTVTYPVDTKTYIDRKIQEAIDGLSGS